MKSYAFVYVVVLLFCSSVKWLKKWQRNDTSAIAVMFLHCDLCDVNVAAGLVFFYFVIVLVATLIGFSFFSGILPLMA